MDAGIVGARLASSVVAPLIKQLFAQQGRGADLVEKPVLVARLVSFVGRKRTLDESEFRKIASELVRRSTQRAGPGSGPDEALPEGELEAVTDAIHRTLRALGRLGMDDVQAVQLGHQRLAAELRVAANCQPLLRSLSADATVLYESVLDSACLHILHFFTQRSPFVARTLVEHSRQLDELITRADILIERFPSLTVQDAEFEERYARHLAKKHSRLMIYGVDLDQSREWPLDTAYLSLQATSATEPRDEPGWQEPLSTLPVEQILASRERVLLRGVAGSGKTTLVQWLAVTTARQEKLTGRLAHLIGRVPFVLPLRTLTRGGARLPAPRDFLGAAGCPVSGAQPQGWADRVLTAGRGVLLVDGIDEVPENERERTRRWLCDLLDAFPDNLWLVTSRPSAVREDWLGTDDFAELTLAPMSREDVAVFVHRWHEAAEAGPALEQSLLDAVRTKSDLARLATNPLMCGLICALHRERRGFLPRGRKALYDAALSMLLERRDRERDMDVARSGMELDEESQVELLQKLAYWLIRNGRAEMERADAVELLGRVLPSMPYVTGQGSTEEVFRHLLERSGLLREPAAGAVDFVHRTFQDYLGARAAIEERDFDLLVRHAHLDQWEDVIRMAVAHARPDERARLLRGLAERGDAEPDVRTRLRLLAMACLEHATKLDPLVRAEVERRAATLIPPRSIDEAKALAAVGPVVLELLPGPEGLEEDEAQAVVHTAAQIGGEAALPKVLQFRDHPAEWVHEQLGSHWSRFDTDTYAREIIEPLTAEPHVGVIVRSGAELAALGRLGGHQRVRLHGDFTAEQICAHLRKDQTVALRLANNGEVTDLGFLSGFTRLRDVELRDCPGIVDLSPLAGLPLDRLTLAELSGLETPNGLGSLHQLARLEIGRGMRWPGFDALPGQAPLTRLALPPRVHDLSAVGALPSLIHLALWNLRAPPKSQDWQAIARHPTLSSLALRPTDVEDLAEEGLRLPRLKTLDLLVDGEPCFLAEIVQVFPFVEHLALYSADEVDLVPLASLPRLRHVHVNSARRIRNAEALPGTVELIIRPRPREA